MSTKKNRMEGYDIARKRIYNLLMNQAISAKTEEENLRLLSVAEYVGIMLSDYSGESYKAFFKKDKK